MSSLARVMSPDIVLFKNLRESRSLRLRLQQKCQEFDVKPTLFPYDVLRVATRDFHEDMKVGDSRFGVLYKGVLPNGNVVAVKKSCSGQFAIDEFLNQIVLFTLIRHRNLVTLKGCCLHDQQWLLVHEYVENFNVHHILLGPRRRMVSWPVRLKICLGVAQGLHYLHALSHPRIIHRDITANSVLVDRNFDPKIGGFGLALLFPDEQSHIKLDVVGGTLGYIAPDCFLLTEKVDVYSFGILCLEIISGRRGIELSAPPDQTIIGKWAWRLHEEDRLLELVDPTLELTDVEVRDVQRVIKVCLMCLQNEAESRPSMARIVSILQGDTEWDGQVKRLGLQENGLLSFASGSSLGSLSNGA